MEKIIIKFIRSFDKIVRNGDFIESEGRLYKVKSSLKDYCRVSGGLNINFDKIKKLNHLKYFCKFILKCLTKQR